MASGSNVRKKRLGATKAKARAKSFKYLEYDPNVAQF